MKIIDKVLLKKEMELLGWRIIHRLIHKADLNEKELKAVHFILAEEFCYEKAMHQN